MRSTFVRYLLAGATNTVASYLLYLALLEIMGYRGAYVVSFVSGIALSYVLMRFAVFQSVGRRFSSLLVAASHLIQLVLGLAVVELWVRWLEAPAELAALAAVAVCVPLMFMMQRWIFMSSRGGSGR